MSTSTDWRAKYLSALAEQEKLEKQVAAHADMLRRTVVHLSSASDGLSQSLDSELSLLKEKLRGASGSAVNDQLGRVEQAVKHWHHERANYTRATCEILSQFTDDFEALRLDTETQRQIKDFKRTLTPDTLALYQQAQWLQSLRKLQQTALKVAAAPDKNIWQRINGGTRLLSPHPKSPAATTQTAQADQTTAPPSDLYSALNDEGTSIPPTSLEFADTPEATTSPENAITIEHSGELESLLHEIFSAIVPTEDLAVSIIEARKKIDNGVTGDNIAEFLRSIRDILQTSYMNYGAEFSNYLVHIDAELARICHVMDHHLEDAARQMSHRALQNKTLEQSQDKLATTNKATNNIDELKFAVMEHITVIEKNLIERRQDNDNDAQQNKALRKVADQLQKVELEAKTTKTLVEKEQHQANRDALTGLPNRAGCCQRIEHECERFQRYNHPVTLALCNIDGLANFNEYGYIIGDRVLKLVATTLRERLRSVDFVGRYNNDKFLIVLPETPPDAGRETLDKICTFIARTPVKIKGKPVTVTVSIALATFTKDEDGGDCYARLLQGLNTLHEQGGNGLLII
ncbi:MAG TPA: GGDEF domain-containing protein [Marinagarivorans sp.]